MKKLADISVPAMLNVQIFGHKTSIQVHVHRIYALNALYGMAQGAQSIPKTVRFTC